MKQFELTLTRYELDKIQSFNKIEADNLVDLLSQLQLVIICIQREIYEDQLLRLRYESNDDIPF